MITDWLHLQLSDSVQFMWINTNQIETIKISINGITAKDEYQIILVSGRNLYFHVAPENTRLLNNLVNKISERL